MQKGNLNVTENVLTLCGANKIKQSSMFQIMSVYVRCTMYEPMVYKFPYENEKWASHRLPTEAVDSSVDRSCPLIRISAHGLHMFSSVGRSCPLTFNLLIIYLTMGCPGAAQTVRLHSGQLAQWAALTSTLRK